jgi:hypothetical protein
LTSRNQSIGEDKKERRLEIVDGSNANALTQEKYTFLAAALFSSSSHIFFQEPSDSLLALFQLLLPHSLFLLFPLDTCTLISVLA